MHDLVINPLQPMLAELLHFSHVLGDTGARLSTLAGAQKPTKKLTKLKKCLNSHGVFLQES